MWTSQSVNVTVEKWKKNKSIMGEEGQLFFAAQVLEYRKIVNWVLRGATLTRFTLYGPLFSPPTADEDHYGEETFLNCVGNFLIEPLIALTPEYFPGHNMEESLVKSCMVKVEKQGLMEYLTSPKTDVGKLGEAIQLA
ncbi:hypothetical protein BT69DRAFT_1295230 [Atractiella rhizophila]|nr:hypothetical protein BT69DRAFT_1295230 [Atractiella rhizophila]